MALYHFRVKTDKRPGDGATVKGIRHVEYITREGEFSSVGEQKTENALITSVHKKDALNGVRAVLYLSPYGNITNVEDGILIENNPSEDTLTIALMIAHHAMDEPLIIKGSDKFKTKCVNAAASAVLPLSFYDPEMQSEFLRKKETRQNYGNQRRNSFSKPYPINPRTTIFTAPTAATLPSLRELSMRSLVSVGSEQSGLLVQSDEYDKLADAGAALASTVRWDSSGERRNRAQTTAKTILKNIDANVAANSHVEYINREKAFAKRGDCVYTSNHLPAWANGSPNKFFKAADRYSPKNADRYREIEFALQNELTLKQNVEIVEKFIKENLSDHYYAYAIHDKMSSLEDETHHIHVHIMLSPRFIDDIELKGERQISKYFAYPWRASAKDQGEEKRRNAGAPVDRRFSSRDFVQKLRISYQDTTNEILEKYGKQARIDHRSLKMQRAEALANGDQFLAQLLNRLPERYLPKSSLLDDQNPDRLNKINFRKTRIAYQDLLFTKLSAKQDYEESEQRSQALSLEENIERILTSLEWSESAEESDNSFIGELRSDFLAALKTYSQIKDKVEPKEQLLEKAKLEYMKEDEKEIFAILSETEKEIDHWISIAEYIHEHKLETEDSGEIKAYSELFPALVKKIDALEEKKVKFALEAEKIEKRLASPSVKKQIQLIVNRNLRDNRHQWLQIRNAEQNLSVAMKTLEQALFGHASETEIKFYRAKEIYRNMQRRVYGYRKETENLKNRLAAAKRKMITLDRARIMAESVYTRGEAKALRETDRKLRKVEAAIKQKLADDPTNTYLLANLEKAKIDRAYLTARQSNLQKRLATPKAQTAIQEIALKIVDQHSSDNKKYSKILAQYNMAVTKLHEAENALPALKAEIKKDPKGEHAYRVETREIEKEVGKKIPAELLRNGRLDEPGIIAKALLHTENCPKFVSRATLKDDDQGLKNWSLMTEIEKQEEEEKRIYHDI